MKIKKKEEEYCVKMVQWEMKEMGEKGYEKRKQKGEQDGKEEKKRRCRSREDLGDVVDEEFNNETGILVVCDGNIKGLIGIAEQCWTPNNT